MAGDLETLLEMGFAEGYAKLAVKKTGNCELTPPRVLTYMFSIDNCLPYSAVQQAIDWLATNQDKPLEEIQAAASAADDDDEEKALNIAAGEHAKSIVCKECNKKFRTTDEATYHATKT